MEQWVQYIASVGWNGNNHIFLTVNINTMNMYSIVTKQQVNYAKKQSPIKSHRKRLSQLSLGVTFLIN